MSDNAVLLAEPSYFGTIDVFLQSAKAWARAVLQLPLRGPRGGRGRCRRVLSDKVTAEGSKGTNENRPARSISELACVTIRRSTHSVLPKLCRAMRTPIYRVVGIHEVVLLPAMRTPGNILRTIPPYVTAHNIAVAAGSHLSKLVIGQLVTFRPCKSQNVFRCFARTQTIPLVHNIGALYGISARCTLLRRELVRWRMLVDRFAALALVHTVRTCTVVRDQPRP